MTGSKQAESNTLRRPQPGEYAPFYAGYVDTVPAAVDTDILDVMEHDLAETVHLLEGLTEEQETFRYAPGKWSVRELVGHLVDTEWTFAMRALCFARRDPTPRPGMDENAWAEASNAGTRPLAQLLPALTGVRAATLALFRTFDDEIWTRTGVASGVSFTVRCMPFILVGHQMHHRRVLAERYLDTARGA